MGRRRKRGRDIAGIVLLDKPLGATSNEALQEVKRLYRAQKAGHTGSLDPLATGLLPICLGEATKISGFLLDADKRYRMACRLGVKTATGDAEGEVVETRAVPALDEARIDEVLAQFRGTIQQVPPMYSALKHQGQRLYRLARQGQEVEREARTVTVRELTLVDFADERLELDVKCSKGTYVRTLAEDIGDILGCGAHVTELRRLEVGAYRDPERMITLEELRHLAEDGLEALDAQLQPVDSALADWPEVRLTGDSAYYLRQGQPVLVPRAPTRGWVRLYGEDGTLFGVGEILDDGRVAPRRLLQLRR